MFTSVLCLCWVAGANGSWVSLLTTKMDQSQTNACNECMPVKPHPFHPSIQASCFDVIPVFEEFIGICWYLLTHSTQNVQIIAYDSCVMLRLSLGSWNKNVQIF